MPNVQPKAAKFTKSRDRRSAGGLAQAEKSGASAAGHSAGEKSKGVKREGIRVLTFAVLNNENNKIESGQCLQDKTMGRTLGQGPAGPKGPGRL